MRPPPSRVAWLADGEMFGHTVAQTVRYLSECADWDDEQQQARSLPMGCISPDVEPRLVTWLHRLLRR